MIVDKQYVLEIREGNVEYSGNERIVKTWLIDLVETFISDDRSFRRGKVTTVYTAFSEREVKAVHDTLELVYGVATDAQKERSEIEMTEKFAAKAKEISVAWGRDAEKGSVEQRISYNWNDSANIWHNEAEDLRKETYNDWD